VGLAADLLFVAMLAVVTVTDLRERRIPDRVLGGAVAVGLPFLAVADPGSMPGRLLAVLLAGGAFLALALVRPDGFGMGDVKLIAVIGLFLGDAVLGAVLVALLAGSLCGLALIVRHGPAAAKLTIPFGPFLALGALLTLVGVSFPLQ
jgi:prepilin signal peptidase PulO-like enzyme (type II secretory pathway)